MVDLLAVLGKSALLLRTHPLGLFDTKAVLEDFPRLLEGQSGNFGVEEVDKDGAEEAEAGVEPEGSRGRDAVDQREEGRTDDEVAAPVARGRKGGPESADVHLEELGLVPRKVADA